jgi:hypothetical protein
VDDAGFSANDVTIPLMAKASNPKAIPIAIT